MNQPTSKLETWENWGDYAVIDNHYIAVIHFYKFPDHPSLDQWAVAEFEGFIRHNVCQCCKVTSYDPRINNDNLLQANQIKEKIPL